MDDDTSTPPRPASFPPGYDDDDPYEGRDLDEYPDWWIQNIELFREHDMRPYRPPQFADGEITLDVVSRLESDLDVEIQLKTVDPEYGGPWEIWVAGEPVASVERSRNSEGRTVYSLTESEFESIVRSAVADRG